MTSTDFSYSSSEGVVIEATRWEPSGNLRGIVQLAHGMGEHIGRYDALAGQLTEHGYAVFGQDHRGHGRTAGSAEQYGHLGEAGWRGLVDDIGRLGQVAREHCPGVPLALVGHSMGSFAAQQFVLDHSGDIDALALTGTAAIDIIAAGLDENAEIDLSMFNAPFAPARTDFDWLSRDEAEVDKYIADDRCGFGLDGTAAAQMFDGARDAADPQRLAGIRHDLPVYIAVGELDPVNGQLAFVQPLLERYRQVLDDVEFTVYPAARHEILNETNRAEVIADLIAWLGRVATS